MLSESFQSMVILIVSGPVKGQKDISREYVDWVCPTTRNLPHTNYETTASCRLNSGINDDVNP